MRLALRSLITISSALLVAAPLGAQADSARARPDSVNASPPAPAAKAPAPAPAPPFDFSGVLFANFQYGGPKGNRVQDRFELERAYLTFRAPAGERASVRVTADVFQQTSNGADAFYRGWTVRAKYAYVDYRWLNGTGDALRSSVRLGMLHTPIIDTEEQYWIRGISPTAVEQAGFFSSADMGAANVLTLPNKLGELYTGVFNGPGYTSRETDRFKDYGARLTLTPFSGGSSLLKGLAVSPWFYKGARASTYLAGQGTVDPVLDARKRDRYGVHAALKDPRFVLGAQLAARSEEAESADTLVDTEVTVRDRESNSLLSTYAIVRPLAFVEGAPGWPLVLLARYDKRPDRDADTFSKFWIFGAGLEVNPKTAFYLDYQSTQPQGDSRNTDTKTWFLRVIANY